MQIETDIITKSILSRDIDLRKKKTRLAAEQALIRLLNEKNIEDITICELATEATINRKTFYNNFASIESVAMAIEEDLIYYLLNNLPARITLQNEHEIYNFFLSLTNALEPYNQLISKLFLNNSNRFFITHLQKILEPYILNSFSEYDVNQELIPYVIPYIINGISSIYGMWFTKSDISATEISKLVYNLVISSIKLDNFKNIN